MGSYWPRFGLIQMWIQGHLIASQAHWSVVLGGEQSEVISRADTHSDYWVQLHCRKSHPKS
jgi:hypothetical protein